MNRESLVGQRFGHLTVIKINNEHRMGVCSSGKGYRAYISRDGTRKHLGWFKTIDEAMSARKQAEEKYLVCGQI